MNENFVHAAGRGRVKDVVDAISNGQDVNYLKPPRNDSALMYASYFGHVHLVKVLLAAGADAQLMDSGGADALRHAIAGPRYLGANASGRDASIIARLLIESGCNVTSGHQADRAVLARHGALHGQGPSYGRRLAQHSAIEVFEIMTASGPVYDFATARRAGFGTLSRISSTSISPRGHWKERFATRNGRGVVVPIELAHVHGLLHKVVVLLVQRGERPIELLMLSRSAHVPLCPNTWSWVGEHVEPGDETVEVAAWRALREELAVHHDDVLSLRELDVFLVTANLSGEALRGAPMRTARFEAELVYLFQAVLHPARELRMDLENREPRWFPLHELWDRRRSEARPPPRVSPDGPHPLCGQEGYRWFSASLSSLMEHTAATLRAAPSTVR